MSQHSYLVYSGNSTTAFGKMYRIDGNGKITEITVNWLAAPPNFLSAHISPDGKYCALTAVGGNNRLRILKRISSVQWDEVPQGNIAFAVNDAQGLARVTCEFSPDSKWLAVLNSSGYLAIYAVNSANDTFTATEAASLVSTGGEDISWRDNLFISVLTSVSPFLYHFSINATTGIRTPVTITYSGTLAAPSSAHAKIVYSPDGTKLIATSANADSTKLYTISGTTYTVDPNFNPKVGGASVGADNAAWSRDGLKIVLSLTSTPYFSVVKKVDTNYIEYDTSSLPVMARSTNGLEFGPDGHVYAAMGSNSNEAIGRVQRLLVDHELMTVVKDDPFITYTAAANLVAVSFGFTTADVVTRLFDHSLESLVLGEINLASLKIALLNSSAVFDKTDTTLTEVIGANEVFGSSWPQGGIAITSHELVKQPNGDASLKIVVPDTTLNDAGTITFQAAVVYDDSHVDKKPLAFIAYDNGKTATQFDVVSFILATESLIYFDK